MKRWVLILAAVTAFGPVSVSGKPNNARHHKHNIPKSNPAAPITSYSYNASCCTTQASAKSPDEAFSWHAAVKRPEWWAVGLGLGTLGVVLLQTIQTKKAAQAALLNAKAVINSERALLLFNVSKDVDKDMYIVRVINYGRVPARKIEISSKSQAFMSVEDLISVPPDYGQALESIQEYLAPNESWPVAYIVGQRTPGERFYNKTYPAPTTDFITYGQVTYLDGMSPEIRHSRYCIALDVDDRYEPISVVGSEEYLECT